MGDKSEYTLEYRILAAVWYFECDKSIASVRLMKSKLRDRYDCDPPDTRYIKQWSAKLFSTGSILDSKRPGRPNERGDKADEVEISITNDPTMSTRRRSDELDMSRSSLLRVMKQDLGYHSFKPVKVQFLSEADHLNRVTCCEQILNHYDNGRRRDKLFFSDECAIYAEGKCSTRLCFWSKANPHFWEEVKQHPPTVMVWAAMSAKYLIGPFFMTGGITAEKYIAMLENEFMPALTDKGVRLSCHFQQDGAPAHTAIATRDFLNQHFPDRWIGKYGPVSWPPRSPDLSSCDNALWGILKPKIVTEKAQSVEQLKAVIRQEFLQFPKDLLQKINDRTFRRFHLCIEKNGLQVDPFDI